MPYKKSKPMRKQAAKRTYKKKSTYLSPNQYPGFPQNKIVKMKYVENVSFDLTSLGQEKHTFRANSIFDPYVTGIGHQPIGHDQWNLFYNHYCVLGAKITAQFTSGSNDTGFEPVMYTVLLLDDTTTTASILDSIEQGKAHYTLQNGQVNAAAKTIRNTYSAKKFFNVADVKDNLDRIGAPFGSNPTDEAIFQVGAQTIDEVPSAQGHNALITIEYIVMMSEPKELVQS